ncbi:MAG: sulfurtransferase TusA family protein [Magnetococcales bacterium]|nr:sulfurtransferase TusA family protein [Magnetococcales bacterium]
MSENTPSVEEPVVDLLLDARRLLCPLPILRAEAAISRLAAGAVLAVQATDPGFAQDLPAWCKVNGHHLLGMRRQGQELLGWVAKGGGAPSDRTGRNE